MNGPITPKHALLSQYVDDVIARGNELGLTSQEKASALTVAQLLVHCVIKDPNIPAYQLTTIHVEAIDRVVKGDVVAIAPVPGGTDGSH